MSIAVKELGRYDTQKVTLQIVLQTSNTAPPPPPTQEYSH
jgi:hypothetical protein